MKTLLTFLALAAIGLITLPAQADPVKTEEAFDKAAGLFDRSWKPTAKKPVQFPSPTPPQVKPGPPPWSQQPQGAQTPATSPTFIIIPES